MEKVLPSDFTNGQEMLGDGDNLGQHEKDPYDNFMKRHLQHYGYYTGQNASYRENFRSLQEWRRNYDVRLSGHHNLSLVEEQLSRHGQLPSKILDNPSVFSTDGQLPDELLHRTTQLVFQYQAGRKIPKLREPRNLYALTKEAGPQQATRWPSHMQVVCPAIRFIEYDPPVPHPLYEPTGKEITPGVRGPSSGEMIYYNEPGRDLYFMRSRVAGCRLAMRSTTLTPREYSEDNLTLEFESRFESGNLLKVDKITDFDYELTLRTDLYTNKHTQWFFFRVRNMRPERTYRFTIINLMKPSSLYNQGMKPVYYSEVNAKKNKIGWIRVGSNIRYYRNNMCGRDGRSYYSLTWTCQFPFKDDCCYFAHCFPYTYSDLQEYLLQLANDPVRSRFCKQRVLTRTLAGNLVYILTITSPSRNPEISRAKKAVVITARVHPGETNASWMMKGFLDYLTGSSADAKLLRDSFIFKIIPMLNPDGVIVGNYRCSLAGRDLNRNYKSVLKDSFPSIWHAKMMIKRLSAEREVVVYCDLHGHSRKNNIFIYGCENKHNRQRRLQERVFPLMLAKNASQSFSYDSCKYKVQKSKEGTGRIVVWYMGIMNSYTMEATFGGTSLPGERQNTHLSTRDLEIMGHTFCDTLLDYCDPDSSKVEACMRELQDNLRRQIMKKFQIQNGDVSDVNIDDYISEMESDTSGSDSSCDDGLPVHLLAIAPKLQRKKKLRSKKDRGRALAPKPSGADSSKLPNTQSAKAANDRTKMRYTQGVSSGKRREERTAASTTIVTSTAVDNGHHDKSAKKSEYLEALTSAYLRSGVLMVPEKKKDFTLRYTSNDDRSSEKFAVKYIGDHVSSLAAAESGEESGRSTPLVRNASCQWSPQPESQDDSESEAVDEDDVTKEAMLAEEQYELLRQSALRRQLSASQQRLLAQKHLVAVANMEKKKERVSSATSTRSFNDVGPKQQLYPFEDPRKTNDVDSLMLVTKGGLQTNCRVGSATHRTGQNELYRTKSGGSRSSTFGERQHDEKAKEQQQAMNGSKPRPNSSIGGTKFPMNPKPSSILPQSTETSVKIDLYKPPTQIPDPASVKTAESSISPTTTSSAAKFHDVAKTQNSELQEQLHGSQMKKRAPTLEEQKEDRKQFGENGYVQEDTCKNTPISSDVLSPLDLEANEIAEIPYHASPYHSSPAITEVEKPLPEKTDFVKLSNHQKLSSTRMIKIPKARTFHQTPMNGMIKGDTMFPKTSETASIPSGIKKTTTLVMEPEPDKLSIQNNRPSRMSPSEFESLPQKHAGKTFQTSDDSFFGMSDRIGLGVLPRNGRVPPVVANIAELRRSLMGQGREVAETKGDSGRKIISQSQPSNNRLFTDEGFQPGEDAIPFSQRPRRINHAALSRQRQRGFTEIEGGTNDNDTNRTQTTRVSTDYVTKEDKHERADMMQRSKSRRAIEGGNSPGKDDTLSEEDCEVLSTVACLNERPRNRRRRRNYEKQADDFAGIEGDITRQDSQLTSSRSEPEFRRFSRGNATVEKLADSSMTNIRIGARTTKSRADEQWFDSHQRQEGNNLLPSTTRSDKQTISSVSLNMKGEMDDRTCATTPALASRPVPPLLRYLSAKQVQNKKR